MYSKEATFHLIFSTCSSSMPIRRIFCANGNKSEARVTQMRETSQELHTGRLFIAHVFHGQRDKRKRMANIDGCLGGAPLFPLFKKHLRGKRPAGSHHKLHGSATSSQCQYPRVCVWGIKQVGVSIPPIKYTSETKQLMIWSAESVPTKLSRLFMQNYAEISAKISVQKTQ